MSGRISGYPAADTPKDFGTDKEGKARRWHAEIDKATKESQEWLTASRRILERYKDMGPGRRGVGQDYTWGMRFNIFWSNVQTLAPSLYASTPQVVVERRWGDDDDVGRVACMMLQRITQYQLEGSDFDTVMRNAVLDHLICGRGTAWVRYEPHFDRSPLNVLGDPMAAPMPAGVAGPGVSGPAPLPSSPPPAGPPLSGGVGQSPPGAAAGPGPGTQLPGPAPAMPGPGLPQGMPPPGPAGGAPILGGAPSLRPPPPAPPGVPVTPPGQVGQGGGPPDLGGFQPPPMAALPPIPPGGLPVGHIDAEEGLRSTGKPFGGGVQIADDGEGDGDGEFLAFEEVRLDHVHWEDWFSSPARTWAEVRWVARRVYMTQDEGVKRFGAVFKDVELDWLPRDIGETEAMQPENRLFRRAQVFEIWDKPTRRVYWLAHGFYDRLLDEREDPLRLIDFFPCPRPMYATLTTESLIPVPDYQLYRDQAVQIDTLTARIEALAKSIKVTGVYDAAQDGVQRMFAEGVENQLIPVNQWGAFAEQGGLKGCLDLLDIGMLAEVLGKLVEVRAQAKNDLYEVTGISDIIRGTSAAAETATAQQIKAGFGTMRLRARQNEVARFARDLIRITAEVVCEHFNPRVMALIADVNAMGQTSIDDMLVAPAAIKLLKSDRIRPLRIDIEADSTILANHQQEQQSRIQFLQMASQFLQQAVPAVQQTPQIAPLLGQMLLFGIRSFPQGAELEGAFERAIKDMETAAKQAQLNPQPAQQDPKMIVANAQVRNINSQIQDRQTRSMADAAANEALARERMARLAIEKQKADDKAASEAVDAFHDHTAAQRDYLLEVAKLRQQAMDAAADRRVAGSKS